MSPIEVFSDSTYASDSKSPSGSVSSSDIEDGGSMGSMPIAIIGMAFKFPGGADTSESFWQMLAEGRNAAIEIPMERFNIDAFWHHDSKRQGITNTRRAHLLKGDHKAFDAGFFSMNPQEVEAMDPQQRGLLETTYHALENAGLSLKTVAGSRTAVHVGCFTNDWMGLLYKDTREMPKYAVVGTAGSILANRISWFYDLRGESTYIDTACSSGLVAVSQACQTLASGNAEMAIASASNVILGPEFNVALSNLNMLSPSGLCQSFDAKGDGYGRGEGLCALILKPAAKAIADGDPIRAVIRATGMNQDGHTSGGITQPSKEMQAQLIRETYLKAGLSMHHTRFFEAHGTGTAVGDPIEARAIGEAFFKYRTKDDPIYVGAVKSNIGHLEGTSGLASIVKSVLMLENGIIPPNTNFETLNPQIDADFLKLKFPTECIPWPKAEKRRISVNSFGFGGSNAHIVLESADDYIRAVAQKQPPGLYNNVSSRADSAVCATDQEHVDIDEQVPGSNSDSSSNIRGIKLDGFKKQELSFDLEPSNYEIPTPQLLVISTDDEEGIKRHATALNGYLRTRLRTHGQQLLKDVTHTLSTRRTHLPWRSYAIVGATSLPALLDVAFSKPSHRAARGEPDSIGFLFTGQGAQWASMGCELLQWPIFRASILQSQSILASLGCSWTLIDEIKKTSKNSLINHPEFSQTITTAIQIALVDLVFYVGIKSTVVVGHSSGEIAAAYCAGFLCHESAIKASYFRGYLASKLANADGPKHGMASVGLSLDQTTLELSRIQENRPLHFDRDQITVSCVNSPSNVTVSGPSNMLEILVEDLSSKSIFARRLKVNVGYHSSQMHTISSEYSGLLTDLRPGPSPGRVRMVSTVTPGLVSLAAICSKEYWVLNMISPVRFVEAMELCCRASSEDGVVKKLDRSHLNEIITHGWLEIEPHAALKGPLRQIIKSINMKDELLYSSLLVRNQPANHSFLDAIGQLHCSNFAVNFHALTNIDTATQQVPRILSDLPQYHFNHSVIHWGESTRSRLFRTRQFGHHDLLGTPTYDWNPTEPTWTFTIKKDELPWISEHRVHGRMMYPAAGMCVMVIEAIKQLLGDQKVLGFEFQDVYFLAPIVLNDSPEGVETQLSMVSASDQGTKDLQYKFHIYLRRADDAWGEVCHGSIQADYGRVIQNVDYQAEDEHRSRLSQTTYDEIFHSCQNFLDTKELYSRIMKHTKLQYGPLFQPLSDIGYDSVGNAHATILPYEKRFETGFEDITIHPSTLDGIFQLALVALTGAIDKPTTTLVPARLTRMWISSEGSGHGDSESEVAHSQAESLSARSAVFSSTVFSKPDMQVRVMVEELEVIEAGEETPTIIEESTNALCHELHWNVDLGLLDNSQVFQHCSKYRKDIEEPQQFYSDLTITLLRFAAQSLARLSAKNQTPVSSLARYSKWLQARVDDYLAVNPTEEANQFLYDPQQLQDLSQKLSKESKRGMFNVHIGRSLTEILTGEVDPMGQIMSDEELLAGFYEEVNNSGKALDMLQAYLDALVHKNPNLKFLEIGAGTGATTVSIMDTIASGKVPRFEAYHYTDISASFLAKAKERFSGNQRMEYMLLNIESDLDAQDFGETRYDVIVAANVLHATKELSTTLLNVRQLLKPGGKLILLEMTTPRTIHTAFVFGMLPGWWLGTEEFRSDGAVISEAKWDVLLKQHGFSGTDQVFLDWDTEQCHGWSIMISTTSGLALPEPAISHRVLFPTATLVTDKNSDLQNLVAATMVETLGQQSCSADVLTIDDLLGMPEHEYRDRNFILMNGLERSLLNDFQPTEFEALKKATTLSRSVLFVNNMGSEADNAPYWAMADGFTRVLRNENTMVTISTLAIEKATCASVQRTVSQIMKVFLSMLQGMESGNLEQEWIEFQGNLCVNRLLPASYADDHVSIRTTNQVSMREFGGGFPIKLEIGTPGLLDTLEWAQDKSTYVPLGPEEVEIHVQAIGINFKECLTLLGRVNSKNLGSECSGYVHRVGAEVQGLHAGDRVAVGHNETYRSFVRAQECQVVRIPNKMTFAEAAAVPTAFCTAYIGLIKVARLQKGESILIHAAAGGTGQATIQIAQYIGAEIFATVSTDEKKRLLMQQYGIQEDHIFYSRDSSFADGIKRITKGYGVDVVLNSLSGKLLVASWEIIAEFGRFIEIGRKDIDNRGHLPMHPFIKNAIFAGMDLTKIIGTPRGQQAMQWVFQKFTEGVLRPIYPLQAFPINEVESAIRLIQSGKSTGKMVIEVSDNAIVPVREGPDSDYRFPEDATYVIAGGLGGIGRRIARWIAYRGGKNILLLSRSGIDQNSKRSKLVEELRELGVNVRNAVCDITNFCNLESALDAHLLNLPPVKGCFQAAMALADRPFATMEPTEWMTAIRPKVQGSWNLHKALPQGLDFFIMLSSAVGIFGNPGQSNYSAGNTFQDALARYRVERGEKAVAIDLGMILGEGFVAENPTIQESLMKLDLLRPISQQELFSIFDYYCDPNVSYERPAASQIITGIELPAAIRKKGAAVPVSMETSLFRCMHQIDVSGTAVKVDAEDTQDIAVAFKEASTLDDAVTLVVEALKFKVCKMLGLDSEERTSQDRMDSFGVDSLVALELRNWLARDLQTDVAIYEILGDTKLIDIAMTVAKKSRLRQESWN